jgi:hypothetical protein
MKIVEKLKILGCLIMILGGGFVFGCYAMVARYDINEVEISIIHILMMILQIVFFTNLFIELIIRYHNDET